MKNRKLPFGYKMELGEIVCYPQEAELVCHIFQQYTAGASFQTLVAELNHQSVSYDEGKLWNKNMVARILGDIRYAGQKGFPAIILEEDLHAVEECRKAKQTPTHMTPAQKVLRQLSRQRMSEKMEERVLTLLNDLIKRPEQISVQRQESCGSTDHGRELAVVLNEMPINEERTKALIFQCAVEQYQRIGPDEYETIRLRQVFTQADSMERLNEDLLQTAVSSIQIDGRQVKLRLKNGQEIAERW